MITIVLNAFKPEEGPGTPNPHVTAHASVGVIGLTPDDLTILSNGGNLSIEGSVLADFAAQLAAVGDRVTLNVLACADSKELLQILQGAVPNTIHDPFGHLPPDIDSPTPAGSLH